MHTDNLSFHIHDPSFFLIPAVHVKLWRCLGGLVHSHVRPLRDEQPLHKKPFILGRC